MLLLLSLAALASAAAPNNNIVSSSGPVTLWNGIGDVGGKDGAPCTVDAQSFCKDVTPGEGRVAACLDKQIQETKEGNVVGKKVSKKCIKELADFKIDRSSHINKDIPLAKGCAEDAAKRCTEANDALQPASVLACLRDANKLSAKCKEKVYRTQKDAVDDYRTDYQLYNACKDTASLLCPDEDPDEIVECLTAFRFNLPLSCANQVSRQERETGADLRLSKKLFSSCRQDYNRWCKDVKPGNMRAQECLEDHLDEAQFSGECKEELENMIAKRVANFSLDTALREACEQDLKDTCQRSLAEIDKDPDVKDMALKCLQTYREELSSEQCKSEVHRRISRAGSNVLFDSGLATACKDDRATLCADVEAGSARVIRCFQDHRSSLNPKCAAALFDHEVYVSEDIDFNHNLKRMCAYEVSELCKDLPHGHGRIIRCLQQELDNKDMSKECKGEVEAVLAEQAKDYRLDTRLKSACESDISALCSHVCNAVPGQVCGGSVLHCLQENQEKISKQECQEEVFYYELMEVRDFRNDVILAQACRGDVEALCKDVEPGDGRVHICLRQNKDLLSEPCRIEETKLAAIEFSDIRLATKLNKLCSEEKAVYCKDVKPGKGRTIRCLLDHMAEPDFGSACKEELQERNEAMKTDIRYDKAASEKCKADIDTYCADARSSFRGQAAVLKCLVSVFDELQDDCQAEMSRSVRMALWDFKPASPLTAVCDEAVVEYCPKKAQAKSGAAFTIGVVGRCLSKAVVESKYLEAQCKHLVMVAAPKDVRSYYDSPEASNAIVQAIADMQAATGMGPVLVDQQSSVTVSGWLAFACIISIIVVVVGLFVWGVKQWVSPDKPHTTFVPIKDGDS